MNHSWDHLTSSNEIVRKHSIRYNEEGDSLAVPSRATESSSLPKRSVRFPPDLSAADGSKFFGQVARAKFFNRYHWLHQQHAITNTSKESILRGLYYENEFEAPVARDSSSSVISALTISTRISSPRIGMRPLSSCGERGKLIGTLSGASSVNSRRTMSAKKSGVSVVTSGSKLSPILLPKSKPAMVPALFTRATNIDDVCDDNVSALTGMEPGDDLLSYDGDSELVDSDDEIEDELIQRACHLENGDDFAIPISPRSSYISSCIREGVNPRASLILRNKVTKDLKLQHMGIGDKMGKLFASSLSGVPYIQSVNLADNNLTDEALTALVNALASLPSLTSVNLSKNTIGLQAAAALGSYLGRSNCPLKKLALSYADVDDYEAAKFVTVLKTNLSLTDIDLAHNKIGAAEMRNTVNPELVTGSEAFAGLLRLSHCRVRSLNLSWNTIRYTGAIDLCSSLSINASLTHLDLSYNGLGELAGLELGKAIIGNRSLHTLLLTNNGLNSVAALTICAGVIENTSLRSVVFDSNPLGK